MNSKIYNKLPAKLYKHITKAGVSMNESILVQLEDIKEFEHNESFENYKNLILSNKDTIYHKGITHKHHVIPRIYYKCKGIKVDDSSDNIVNLSVENHIRAHIYLSNCVVGDNNLKVRLSYPVTFLYNANKDKLLDVDDNLLNSIQSLYENTYELKRKISIETIHRTNKKRSKTLLGHAVSEETRKKISASLLGRKTGRSTTKGRVWITNGVDNKFVTTLEVEEYLIQGWKKGRNMNPSSYNIGRVVSDETRAKISAARKGIKISEETRRKISNSLLGKNIGRPSKYKGVPRSEDTKKKISESRTGFQFSTDSKYKMSLSHKGKEPSNKGKVYLFKITDEGTKQIKYVPSTEVGIWVSQGWQYSKNSSNYNREDNCGKK